MIFDIQGVLAFSCAIWRTARRRSKIPYWQVSQLTWISGRDVIFAILFCER